MVTRKITIKDGYIWKKYYPNNLLDNENAISKRIFLINNFDCELHPALVQTKIVRLETSYCYKQEYLKRKRFNKIGKEEFYPLIDALEYFASIDFVHGDLNRKNIMYTEKGFKITDYEPSLLQRKNGVKQHMVTKPYISKTDLSVKEVTVRTDKIGFFYFSLRINNAFSSIDVVRLAESLDHRKMLKKEEKELIELPYRELLKLAYSYIEK